MMKKNNKSPICTIATLSLVAGLLAGCVGNSQKSDEAGKTQGKPNIVIFYVDDLGYGDVGAYGATKVDTPSIDQLANNGIRFTDAHSSAATCTPSRYSLLTGEYAFRNDAAVLPGDAPLIIDTQKPTLPSMLGKAGYTSAVVGKWHLGLGDGSVAVDWNQEISPGPRQIGFDYSFLLPSTGDRVPSVYMENGKVLNLSPSDPLQISYSQKIGDRPSGTERPDLLRQQADPQHSNSIINGISRIGFMQGGQSAEWKDEDFYQVFTDKANNFIRQNQNKPFFLFFSFHDIHVPRLPNKQFIGKSDMGLRGDAIVQMDWITGQIVQQLKSLGQLDNTLIIFTSDNGPVLNDGYEDGAVENLNGHKPGGQFSGGKYSAYEAGTRVPTIVHYPDKVQKGTSDSLMSQVDIYASLARLVGVDLAIDEAIDSQDHMAAWLESHQQGRRYLVEESYTLSLRDGNWKYIKPTLRKQPWVENDKGINSGLSDVPQLYNLDTDAGEQTNLAEKYTSKVIEYDRRLNRLVNKKTRDFAPQ